MREADAQTAVRDDFAESCRDGEAGGAVAGLLLLVIRCGGGRGGGAERNVEVAFDELQVGRDAAQEGVDGGGGQVAQAEDLADFARGEEFLELWWWGALAGCCWFVGCVLDELERDRKGGDLCVLSFLQSFKIGVLLRECPSPSRQPG